MLRGLAALALVRDENLGHSARSSPRRLRLIIALRRYGKNARHTRHPRGRPYRPKPMAQSVEPFPGRPANSLPVNKISLPWPDEFPAPAAQGIESNTTELLRKLDPAGTKPDRKICKYP